MSFHRVDTHYPLTEQKLCHYKRLRIDRRWPATLRHIAVFLCLGAIIGGGSLAADELPGSARRLTPQELSLATKLPLFAPFEKDDARTWSETANSGYEARGKMRLVSGVTCDNGLAVPLERWSYVVISLPLDIESEPLPLIELTAVPEPKGTNSTTQRGSGDVENLRSGLKGILLESNPGAKYLWGSDFRKATNDLTGTLGTAVYRRAQREIWYFPPLEFNDGDPIYRPRKDGVLPPSTRSVRITVRGSTTLPRPFLAQATVQLKRPPVVMVHGINNGPSAWQGLGGVGVGQDLKAANFETYALDYGINDLKRAKPRKTGARYFKGNAPVEYAAEQLQGLVEKAVAERRGEGFVSNRVDILAHSYGGIVSRWFTTSQLRNTQTKTYRWYVNSKNNCAGPNLYSIDQDLYAGCPGLPSYHHVRKLITIASPWRGTPVANIVNEVHGPAPVPAPKDFKSLGEVRMGRGTRRPLNLSRFIDEVLDIGGVPDRVPSLEVAAVESRWLRELNRQPFCDDIAYEAIAGNKNAYVLKHIDLFSTLCESLPAGVLPVLQQERIARRRNNLSDGLIPVWSAVIHPGSPIFYAAHNSIMWNKKAKEYLLSALDNASLEGGRSLNDTWGKDWAFKLDLPEEQDNKLAAETRKWTFTPEHMAPIELGGAYQLLTSTGVAGGQGKDDAVARIGAYYLENDVMER